MKNVSVATLSGAVQWPGDTPNAWLIGESLTAPALALVTAVVQRYGSGDAMSIEHLNRLNRLLGASEDLLPEDEEEILSFNHGRLAPPRALCSAAYADYMAHELRGHFEEALSDFKIIHRLVST